MTSYRRIGVWACRRWLAPRSVVLVLVVVLVLETAFFARRSSRNSCFGRNSAVRSCRISGPYYKAPSLQATGRFIRRNEPLSTTTTRTENGLRQGLVARIDSPDSRQRSTCFAYRTNCFQSLGAIRANLSARNMSYLSRIRPRSIPGRLDQAKKCGRRRLPSMAETFSSSIDTNYLRNSRVFDRLLSVSSLYTT